LIVEKRSYQYNFSSTPQGAYDIDSRTRKARTMIAVIEDYTKKPLGELSVLDVGGSTGYGDNYLADHFGQVISIDIDEQAIQVANDKFSKGNLTFLYGDALNLHFADNSFDIVICSNVYEHVTNPERMMDEIFRVLKPGGICYFSAANRWMLIEPHYNLPLLSVMPRCLAHIYIKLTGKADHYHEVHYTLSKIKKLVRRFKVHDYTVEMIYNPVKYHIEYLLKNRIKAVIARFVVKNLYWLTQGYILILEKH